MEDSPKHGGRPEGASGIDASMADLHNIDESGIHVPLRQPAQNTVEIADGQDGGLVVDSRQWAGIIPAFTDEPPATPNVLTSPFVRPVEEHAPHMQAFAFFRPSKVQLDMQGTRRGPAVATGTATARTRRNSVSQNRFTTPSADHSVTDDTDQSQPLGVRKETELLSSQAVQSATAQHLGSLLVTGRYPEQRPPHWSTRTASDQPSDPAEITKVCRVDDVETSHPQADINGLDPDISAAPCTANLEDDAALSSRHSQLRRETAAAAMQRQIVHTPAPRSSPPPQAYASRMTQRSKEGASQANEDCREKAEPLPRRSMAVSQPSKGIVEPEDIATAPAHDDELHSDESSSEINDFLNIVSYQVHKKQRTERSRFAVERQGLQDQLRQVVQTKQLLLEQRNSLLQERNGLTAAVSQQRSKLATYEAKMQRLKVFVDGLGHDIDALRREAGINKEKSQQLALEGAECKAEQVALAEHMFACAEKSTQLKDVALKACHAAESELQGARLRTDYLEKQLDEKSGMLVEERDRRAQLERQIIATARSDERILQDTKGSNDQVLDQLYIIHAALEHDTGLNDISVMVEKTFAAIQALTTQHSANADDIESVKALVTSLSESVTKMSDASSVLVASEKSATHAARDSLVSSCKSLQAGLDRLEQLMQQHATEQGQLSQLREQLADSSARCGTLQTQLEKAQSSSRATVAVESGSPPKQGDDARELVGKLRAGLQGAQAQLCDQTKDIGQINAVNADLRAEVERLQQRLNQAQKEITDLDAQRKDSENKRRKEFQRYAEDRITQTKATLENDLKRLTATASEVPPLQKQVENLSQKASELAMSEKLLTDQKRECQRLQNELTALSAARKMQSATQAQSEKVAAQLAAAQAKQRETDTEKNALIKQVADLDQAVAVARSSEQALKAQLDEHQRSTREALAELRAKLHDAEAAHSRSETGVAQLKDQCKQEVEAAATKAEKQTLALQQSLDDARLVLKNKDADHQRFEADVEQTWRVERDEHQKALSVAGNELAQVETEKNKALAEVKFLRQQIEQATRTTGVRDVRLSLQQLPTDKVVTAGARNHVLSIAEGITPKASQQEQEPPKPRKKADRTADMIVDSAPVPAAEILRHVSHTAPRGAVEIRGPVVEESQEPEQSKLGHDTAVHSFSSRTSLLAGKSSDNDEMLDSASFVRSQSLSQTTKNDKVQLPSFVAFNNSMDSSQRPEFRGTSPTDSVPPAHQTGAIPVTLQRSSQKDRWQSQDFTVFEEPQSSQKVVGTQQARQLLRGDVDWTQEETERYTYRKSFPQPNSASKVVHRERSGTHDSAQETSKVRGEGRGSAGSLTSERGSSSSSDFMATVSGARKMTTYDTTSASAKRRSSRPLAMPTADPRLTKRTDSGSLKRGFEIGIQQGHGQERKKRKAIEAGSVSGDASRNILRPDVRPSMADLMPASTARSGPAAAASSGSSSRMRTLAGASSRGGRGAKKMSKSRPPSLVRLALGS
ncbi:hypothetical protein BAUCODRAFT_344567 [Baudoinia panamericana UAMH 10762]|uniref:Uncharacterized protein n=1 Tax=Baudoinia panamericana (strain UAMH 10762) TaxID=717646 RepID=M2MS25_BAUPA|nr:uncharacterized protein BAUCODRAFT_344567 [Baudoinia panamericana UAMH 10762]EMC99646.1 hypothetical protein BAUCODRAFT_344567 [Baudoinia panamericana UAMH 10762]